MPAIAMFYGLVIYMYYHDTNKHRLPHIHVEYAECKAVFSLPDGDILEGSLPKAKTKLVLAWIELHQEDLMADWSLAISGQPIFPIEPLR